MAGVKKSDIPDEAKMITMIWELIKDFYIPENTDAYWDALRERSLEIDAVCHSRIGQKLILALHDYLEEKGKDE